MVKYKNTMYEYEHLVLKSHNRISINAFVTNALTTNTHVALCLNIAIKTFDNALNPASVNCQDTGKLLFKLYIYAWVSTPTFSFLRPAAKVKVTIPVHKNNLLFFLSAIQRHNNATKLIAQKVI